MQCPRCKFENMPGITTCFKCGSILAAPSAVLDVHPPRAPGWVKPFRRAGRWTRSTFGRRRLKKETLDLDRLPEPRRREEVDWSKIFKETGQAFLYLVLAVVPGLSHAVQKRFGEVKLYLLAWFAGLILGLFFYGSFPGYLLFWSAIAVHAYIGIRASLWTVLSHIGSRIFAVGLAFVFVYLLYGWIGWTVFPDLRGGFTALNIPGRKVYAGDYLLGRASLARHNDLTRGALVLTSFREVSGYRFFRGRNSSQIYGEIIGLPGERVAIEGKTFYINGKPLDPDRYPVPAWLAISNISIQVDSGSYFVTAEYDVQLWRGGGMGPEVIRETCIVSKDRIEARAFLRWSPIWRRGYLKEP